tara:strand:- start:1447 stop:1647 length:201 start_codon:yes stop_codon:yes gene_type:complete
MSEKEKDLKIHRSLISEFASYPSDILFNMLQMSKDLSETHLIDDDRLKHISKIVNEKIQRELISRN